jgi:hypothetical protein
MVTDFQVVLTFVLGAKSFSALQKRSNYFPRYKRLSPLSISSTAHPKCDTTIVHSSRDHLGVGRVPRSSNSIGLELSASAGLPLIIGRNLEREDPYLK